MIGVIILCVIVVVLITVVILREKNNSIDGDTKIIDIPSFRVDNTTLERQFYNKLKSLLPYENVLTVDGIDIENKYMRYEVNSDLIQSFGIIYISPSSSYCEYFTEEILKLHYPEIDKENRLIHFMSQVVSKGIVEERPLSKVKDKFKKFNLNIFGDVLWVEIGECEYFTNSGLTIYRFSDWNILSDREALKVIEDLEEHKVMGLIIYEYAIINYGKIGKFNERQIIYVG